MGTIYPISIRTAKGEIVIRHAQESDAEAVYRFVTLGMATFTTLASSEGEHSLKSADEQRTHLAKMLADPRALMLIATDQHNAIVGQCGNFTHPKRKMAHHTIVGMMVSPSHQGLGLGRALLTALLNFASDSPNLECVRLGVYANNAPALHLYTSLGFAIEGKQHQYFLHPDGTRHDDLQMAIWTKPNLAPAGFQTWKPTPLVHAR